MPRTKTHISPYSFAARLRSARETRGQNQQELAEKSSIHPNMISDLESGRRNPSVDTLRALADGLDVTTDYLLGRTKDMQPIEGYERIHELLGYLREGDLVLIEMLCAYLVERKEHGSADED